MPSIEEIRSAVVAGIREVNADLMRNGEEQLKNEETFSDFGMDSLDQMNLLLELEKLLSADFDGVEMDTVNSISKLHSFLNAE
jgi:acyl carrier protein